MSALFALLVEEALSEVKGKKTGEDAMRIADSIPIVLAAGQRASQAKIASQLADTGYCSSKSTFFYGVKLHAVAEHRSGTLPLPTHVGLTPGSENDLVALRRVLPWVGGDQLYGDRAYCDKAYCDKAYCDKAYCDASVKERLSKEQNLEVLTPVKKKKGQKRLSAADKLFSTTVSRVRQPIESLLGWINEKTGIQRASKVRSCRGLLVHVFGRLAAAMLLLALNP